MSIFILNWFYFSYSVQWWYPFITPWKNYTAIVPLMWHYSEISIFEFLNKYNLHMVFFSWRTTVNKWFCFICPWITSEGRQSPTPFRAVCGWRLETPEVPLFSRLLSLKQMFSLTLTKSQHPLIRKSWLVGGFMMDVSARAWTGGANGFILGWNEMWLLILIFTCLYTYKLSPKRDLSCRFLKRTFLLIECSRCTHQNYDEQW